MILKVYVEDQMYPIEVPPEMIEEAADFFAMMDRDMDQGYQMSREWVEKPDAEHRCQIAADRILSALHTENEKIGVLMAAYILRRMPGVTAVRLHTGGDMLGHELVMGPASGTPSG